LHDALQETGSAAADATETMSAIKKNNRTSLDRDFLFIESSWMICNDSTDYGIEEHLN